MKILLFSLVSALLTTFAHGQWKSTQYTLNGGWNAIYLHGDASYDTIDNVISNTNVIEVWRWNTSPHQVGFTNSPSQPSAGGVEWSVWKRGLPGESTLTRLTGQCGYLVKCSGVRADNRSFTINQSPMLPANSWVRNGANLLGFPALPSGTNATFSRYFRAFPSVIQSGQTIYKYMGGDLSSSHPQLIDSGSYQDELVDRNRAYWFSAEVTGNFYAPIEIDSSGSNGVDFGRSGNTVTLRLRNHTTANVTVTLTHTTSDPAPANVTPVTGTVPLTRETFDTGNATWTSTPVTGPINETIPATSTVEIQLGVNRALMTGQPDALYASLLCLKDSAGLMEVYLPVTARKNSLAGLWVGDIQLNSVSNKVSNAGRATATVTDGKVTALTVDGSGGFGYVTPPTVTITPPAGNEMILATATAGINSANRTVTSLTLATAGYGYYAVPTVTLSAPTPSAFASFTANLSTSGNVSSLTRVNAGVGYKTAPTVTLSAPATTSNATATAVMDGTSLIGIQVTNSGGYYASAPTVTITAPSTGPRTTATANISGAQGSWTITRAQKGAGYSSVPNVTFSGTNSTACTATAILGLTEASFTINPGTYRYASPPAVTISGGNASGGNTTVRATANATLNGTGAVTSITITNPGEGYSTQPSLTFSGGTVLQGSGTILPTAVGNAKEFCVSKVTKGQNGTPNGLPSATIGDPPSTVTATANVSISSGGVSSINLTGGNLTHVIPGYTTPPTVTINAGNFTTRVTATANATLNGAGVENVTITNGGAGYLSAPTVTFSAPSSAIQATASATVGNNTVTNITLTDPGYGYDSAPTVTLAEPSLKNKTATAIANLANGRITGFTILSAGSGYEKHPDVTIGPPPALTGTDTAGAFNLRTLLHVADNGTAKLLSKAYLGTLAVAPNSDGISTSETLLQTSNLGTARRFTSAHLPTGRVITGSGSVALGGSLACTIFLPYDDPSSPFVHQFHPDHDNKDTRFESAAEGYESYDVSRVGTFTFTTTPPNGATVPGWGSTVIGGTYHEVVTGLHSSAIQLDGTFELRRASEIGTLSE